MVVKWIFSVLFFLRLSLWCRGEILRQCDLTQECINSHWKNFRLTESKERCQVLCARTKDCQWYTFVPHSKLCIALADCAAFRDCKDCVTSQVGCPRCFQPGRCEGTGIRILKTNSAHQCLDRCAEVDSCQSFGYAHGLCGLYTNCSALLDDCDNCVVGTMRHCKYGQELPRGFRDRMFSTKILITGGRSTEGDAKPEIIDLENPGFKCMLEEPQKRSVNVKAILVNDSLPLLCGYGVNFFKDGCRLYLDNGGWKYESDVFNGAVQGSAESFVPGQGWWLSTFKMDTEILRLPTIKTTPGPRLPTALEQHCMVQINDFETMVIGGRRVNSPHSAKTWIFNWSRMEWTFGPDLIQGRTGHVCGLFKNKHLVVGGGNILGKEATNTTEILDLTDIVKGWKPGPRLPRRVSNAAMVQINDFNLIIVGGHDVKNTENPYVNALYQFQLDGWIRLTSRLQIPRSQHSALWIPDRAAASCMKNMNNYL